MKEMSFFLHLSLVYVRQLNPLMSLFLHTDYICVSVCVCVCLRSSTVKASSVWVGIPGDRSIMLCWRRLFSLPSPFITTVVCSTEPFLLAALSCSHTRSGQSHDLTSFICVSLSKYGAFIYRYRALPSIRATSWADLLIPSALTRGVEFWQGKAKVTTNCLLWSNVATSLWRDLLIDALVETS